MQIGTTLGPVNETNMARIRNNHKQTNVPLKKKVFVALSGGVDSAIAAALLKKEGYDVVGVFMRQYDTQVATENQIEVQCTWIEDRRDAMAVAAHLDIPFREWDFRKEYHEEVVSYLVAEYAAGRTPNPDVMCNTRIKFGAFLQRALSEGADYIATGHYVRKKEQRKKGSVVFQLLAGRDRDKDQSYFLYGLSQEQLAHSLFPLGELTKIKVRAMAKKYNLPNAEKKDSQGICFVGRIPMKDFLQTHIPPKPGPLMTRDGTVVGKHTGAAYVTIGQRHGLGFEGGSEPYVVVDKDVGENIVYVERMSEKDLLFRKHLDCDTLHWITKEPEGLLHCKARIRYRQPLQPCEVRRLTMGQYHVVFKNRQRAISPGQAIVFYDKDIVLGGGTIL